MTAPDADTAGPADDWHQTYVELGYLYCRPCREYHRPPECAINEYGQALDPDGRPWGPEWGNG